jgi:PncC family amidohydrolase
VFRGAIVSYATEVKQVLLGVGEGPVVSEAAARQMAHGVRERLGADVGLSLTGVAGPDEQDGQPVGTLYVGIVGPGFDEVRHARLPGQREQMRQFSVITSLGFLRSHLAAG